MYAIAANSIDLFPSLTRSRSSGAISRAIDSPRLIVGLDIGTFVSYTDLIMTKRARRAVFVSLSFFLLFNVRLRTAAEHHDTWIEIQSPHFTVFSNAGEYEGQKTALQFEEIRSLFEQIYPKFRVDPGKPTIVFAIKNEDSLKLFIPSYGQNTKAARLSGFYNPGYSKNFAVVRTDIRGTGPLGFRSLYHEYTNAFFRSNLRGLPLWLEVGLGEYYGNTEIESKSANVGMANVDQLRILKENTVLPIDQLVTIDSTSPFYNTRDHAGIFHAESWALVHYLYNSPDLRDQNLVNKYLTALHVTDDPIEAVRQVFGDLKKFNEKLDSYVLQPAFTYQRIPLEVKISEKNFTARRLSPAEGILAQADFLLRNNHRPEALELLHEVEKLNAATPGYHSELGHYQFLQSDYSNAEKELQLALADNSNDISALTDMAFLYLRRDGYTKDSTPKIRAELETILSLNPDFAPAHAFLSVAYIQDPDKDLNKALNAAIHASNLEPGNLSYFIGIGKVYLAEGRISDARKVADTAQKLATGSNDRSITTSFAKQIEYTVSHPQEPGSVKHAPDEPPADTAPGSNSAEATAHAEGQITELLCGRPPEVLLKLTTAGNSLLLHVSDIAHISIQEGAKPSNDASLPCSKWKDRRAKIDYRAIPSGVAQGEVQVISLE